VSQIQTVINKTFCKLPYSLFFFFFFFFFTVGIGGKKKSSLQKFLRHVVTSTVNSPGPSHCLLAWFQWMFPRAINLKGLNYSAPRIIRVFIFLSHRRIAHVKVDSIASKLASLFSRSLWKKKLSSTLLIFWRLIIRPIVVLINYVHKIYRIRTGKVGDLRSLFKMMLKNIAFCFYFFL
jgi:hypothetical protein